VERHVKERLVGASILLVLVVLLVPEFLSGPKSAPPPPPATLPAPVHTVTVDLNDPSRATLQEPASDASAVSTPAPTPLATSTPADATASAPAPPPTPIETAPNTPIEGQTPGRSVVAGAATRHAPAKGAWSVQLGSFASKANAEKLVQVLDNKGYSAAVSAIGAGAAARYRVRIGQLADRPAADRLIGRLKSQGHVATLVPPT
jgi:cell division septation protein DedD